MKTLNQMQLFHIMNTLLQKATLVLQWMCPLIDFFSVFFWHLNVLDELNLLLNQEKLSKVVVLSSYFQSS